MGVWCIGDIHAHEAAVVSLPPPLFCISSLALAKASASLSLFAVAHIEV